MDREEINKALESLVLLVDTREHETEQAIRRLKSTGLPTERKKLSFGDYSAKVQTLSGEIDFSDQFAIERKMNLDELAICYTSQRERFTTEFRRAKKADAKLYLLVENGSYEAILRATYRSKVSPQAFLASVFTWLARYNCQVIMCEQEASGRLIREIVYREVKERLERG